MDTTRDLNLRAAAAAGNARNQNTQEAIFLKRLKDLKLRATYSSETRNFYGFDQIRFWISIFRDKVLLERTSSGYTSLKCDYKELAFEQANRRLTTIEMYNRHMSTSLYNANLGASGSGKGPDKPDDYADHRNYY